jgi:hypothetical protein
MVYFKDKKEVSMEIRVFGCKEGRLARDGRLYISRSFTTCTVHLMSLLIAEIRLRWEEHVGHIGKQETRATF